MVQRREACGLQGPVEAAMPGARRHPRRSQTRKKDLGQQALPINSKIFCLDLFPHPWNQLQSLLCGLSGANRSRFAETGPRRHALGAWASSDDEEVLAGQFQVIL